MAEHGDGLVFVELCKRATGHLSHGHQLASGNARDLRFPGFTNIKQERRVGPGESCLQLVNGDFKIHAFKDTSQSMSRTQSLRMKRGLLGA